MDEASPEMALRQRLLLQGLPDWVALDCSTTNCHAYKVLASGMQFVICSNTWTTEVNGLKYLEDRKWLHDNSIVVEIGRTNAMGDSLFCGLLTGSLQCQLPCVAEFG